MCGGVLAGRAPVFSPHSCCRRCSRPPYLTAARPATQWWVGQRKAVHISTVVGIDGGVSVGGGGGVSSNRPRGAVKAVVVAAEGCMWWVCPVTGSTCPVTGATPPSLVTAPRDKNQRRIGDLGSWSGGTQPMAATAWHGFHLAGSAQSPLQRAAQRKAVCDNISRRLCAKRSASG